MRCPATAPSRRALDRGEGKHRPQPRARRAGPRRAHALSSTAWKRTFGRSISSTSSPHNVFCCDMAMGGSTNTILHTLALAHSAGIALRPRSPERDFRQRPPASARFHPAGRRCTSKMCTGRAASVASLRNWRGAGTTPLNLNAKTVAGNLADRGGLRAGTRRRRDPAPPPSPSRATGGLAVLFGNLAPRGAVVKVAGVDRGHDGVRRPRARSTNRRKPRWRASWAAK